MQVSVENTGALGRKLTVQVPSEEIESKVSGRIRDLGKQVRLKGFRPGKIPVQVLEKRFGRQVRSEVVSEVIQQTFQDAITEQKLRPVAAPEINTPEPTPNSDLEYTASFEVFPELESLDVAGLKVSKMVANVVDGDVDNMIDTLRRQRQSWTDADREAADGDLVFFHYQFKSDDAQVPEEGEERAGAILGQGAFDPAIEEALTGMGGGAEKEIEVTLSESFREQSVAGKSVEAKLRVEKVQEAQLPEVDEEFIGSFGIEGGDMDAFRDDVRQNLERELKQSVSRQLRGEVIGKLIDSFPELEVPAAMIEAEQQSMQQQVQSQMPEGAESLPMENFREAAERRVRGAVLVGEVARHAELQIDQGRVRDMINDIASTYENPQAIVNLYMGDERLLSGVQNMVLEEQAVDWVVSQATVEENEVSFDEVMQAGQA